ncbi:c-type cytochrome biogenesis protein CcmI [Cereibacter sp. SYSU M97828]|nr:c-type cytochrome biogenesis protein CcmI [Cereibacter flavus]
MTVWIFWLVAGALGMAVAAVLMRGFWREAEGAGGSDMHIYRQQLRDVDRDLERGTLAAAEGERLRLEISRRLLDADRAAVAPRLGRGPVLGAALVAIALGAAVLGYLRLGAPGYADLPLAGRIEATEALRAARPSQAEAAAAFTPPRTTVDDEFAGLMERLREAVTANPEDLRGWQLLARNEGAMGNFDAASEAQARVVELGDGSAADRAALAEAMILSAGGYVSPEAERVLSDALARDAQQPLALYYSGLMMAQGGREDLAFRLWRNALRVAPDAGFAPTIRASMPELAARAGARWEEDAPVGPSQDQIAAMSQLDPAARQEAIGAMVQRLSDRLATRGGTAEEWARLISAYGVLGQTDRAATIWNEARQIFTNDGEQATVRAAAIEAGVAQ